MTPSPAYSKAILNGLRKHGLSPAEVCSMTGLSQSGLRLILQEKASLKDRHLELIERATGLSAGQIAILSEPTAGKALTPLMQAWAQTMSGATSPRGIIEHA